MFTCPRGNLWCRNDGQLDGMQIAVSAGSLEEIADDDDVIASPEWRRGEIALEKSNFEAAVEADRDALRFFEQPTPQHYISLTWWLTWEIVVQLSHCLLRRWLVGRRHLDSASGDLIAARHYGRLSYSYANSYSLAAALWAHLRELNMTEKYGATLERAHAYGQHALLMSWLGWFKRACRYSVDSAEAFETLGNSSGRGHALTIYASVHYVASHLAECIEISRSAITIFESVGNDRDANLARCQLAASYLRLGRLVEAVEEAKCAYHSSVRYGNRETAVALAIWAAASDGDVPPKAIQSELDSHDEDSEVMTHLWQANGICWLSINQFEEAVEAFEKACEHERVVRLAKSYLVPSQVWLTTALRELAERNKDLGGDDGQSLLRRASQAARRGLRMARRFRFDVPHALRECAAIAALQGRSKCAVRRFEESLEVANQLHACYEYAKTLEVRGRLGKRFGWSEAEDDVADGSYMGSRLKRIRPTLIASEGDPGVTFRQGSAPRLS